MRTKSLTTIGTFALVVATAGHAAAQDDPYATDYDYQQQQQMQRDLQQEQLQQEQVLQQQQLELEQIQMQQEDYEFVRFRFGISGVGGAQVADGPDIAMGGAQLRLGVQIGDYLGVYYQPTGLIGSIIDRPGNADEVAGLMWNTAMIEVTLADFIQIGGGPSMDFVWGCDARFQGEADCDSGDPFFGAHGRVALVLGGHGPGGRGGLTISADVHPTWYQSDDAAIAVVGGLGFDLY